MKMQSIKYRNFCSFGTILKLLIVVPIRISRFPFNVQTVLRQLIGNYYMFWSSLVFKVSTRSFETYLRFPRDGHKQHNI